jgi:hypothetical protein
MHITEIALTHQLQQAQTSIDHSEKLKRILTQHGWKSLGTGVEAAVAMHPEKAYVLKIFNSDSKYVDYVKFVQAHQSNPHVPRFSRYVRSIPGTQFSYVRMEKLQKVTENTLLTTYANYLFMMLVRGEQEKVYMLGDDLAMTLEDRLGDRGHDEYDIATGDAQEEIYAKLGGVPPDTWNQVLTDLAAHSRQLGMESWDMHAGNFMRRGKTLVIADPYY